MAIGRLAKALACVTSWYSTMGALVCQEDSNMPLVCEDVGVINIVTSAESR